MLQQDVSIVVRGMMAMLMAALSMARRLALHGWRHPRLELPVTRGTSPELTLLPPGRGRLPPVACD